LPHDLLEFPRFTFLLSTWSHYGSEKIPGRQGKKSSEISTRKESHRREVFGRKTDQIGIK